MLEWLLWAVVVLVGLGVLYMLSFYFRLGRTEKTIGRAVELGIKHLDNPPLSPAEQAEVEEFCRRGILQKVQVQSFGGKTIVLYRTSQDPILAELTS